MWLGNYCFSLSSFRKQLSHLLVYYIYIILSLPYVLFSPALIPTHLTVENQFKVESIIFRFSFFSQGNITPGTRRALLVLELCSFGQVVVRKMPHEKKKSIEDICNLDWNFMLSLFWKAVNDQVEQDIDLYPETAAVKIWSATLGTASLKFRWFNE